MEILLIACAIVPVAALSAAGLAKWNAAGTTLATLREFGIPARAAPVLAQLLPALEMLLAALLLTPLFAWPAAWIALALHAAVALAIGINLLQGRRPACNCFGGPAAPVGWGDALRNVALAACPVLLLWQAPEALSTGLGLWLAQQGARLGVAGMAVLAAAALGVLLLWLLLHLARQQGRLLLQIDALNERMSAAGIPAIAAPAVPGLVVGELMPEFEALAQDGSTVASGALFREGRDLLMLFAGSDCAPCHKVLHDLLPYRGHDKLVVLAAGIPAALPAGGTTLLWHGEDVARRFGIFATPSAFRVRRDGIVATPLAVGRDAILALAGAAGVAELRRPRVPSMP